MTRTTFNTTKIGSLAVCGVIAGWMAATPAQACSGAQSPAGGAKLTANLAAARMRLTLPPSLGGGPAKSKPELEARDVNPPTIAGLWLKTYTQDGKMIDQGFDTFNADGNEMIVDIAPPATDNVCTGVWTQTGSFTYSLYHISWGFDMDGNLLGTAVFRESLTISRDGNTMTGSGTIEAYDNDGNLLFKQGPAQITGARIKPV